MRLDKVKKRVGRINMSFCDCPKEKNLNIVFFHVNILEMEMFL